MPVIQLVGMSDLPPNGYRIPITGAGGSTEFAQGSQGMCIGSLGLPDCCDSYTVVVSSVSHPSSIVLAHMVVIQLWCGEWYSVNCDYLSNCINIAYIILCKYCFVT